MNLSLSNIAWGPEQDEAVYEIIHRYGFTGLEIAPTRILPERPYGRLEEAKIWAGELKAEHGFCVPSMQSIWFGRTEKLFGAASDRQILLDYTKRAVDFAAAVSCGNLVFGCPRNRSIPEGMSGQEAHEIAITFFRGIGEYAARRSRAEEGDASCRIAIGMEANPPMYNTNYINDTASALRLIREVDSKGFLLNLDVGTMIANGESVDILKDSADLINHVHISEPGLKPIERRALHGKLARFLADADYHGYVSIEMGRTEDLTALRSAMEYVKSVFA